MQVLSLQLWKQVHTDSLVCADYIWCAQPPVFNSEVGTVSFYTCSTPWSEKLHNTPNPLPFLRDCSLAGLCNWYTSLRVHVRHWAQKSEAWLRATVCWHSNALSPSFPLTHSLLFHVSSFTPFSTYHSSGPTNTMSQTNWLVLRGILLSRVTSIHTHISNKPICGM